MVPKIQICPATLITLEIVARCRYYPTTLKPSTTLPPSHTANQIIVTLPHFARKSFWNLSLDVAEMGKKDFWATLLPLKNFHPTSVILLHFAGKNQFLTSKPTELTSLRSNSEFCEILSVPLTIDLPTTQTHFRLTFASSI